MWRWCHVFRVPLQGLRPSPGGCHPGLEGRGVGLGVVDCGLCLEATRQALGDSQVPELSRHPLNCPVLPGMKPLLSGHVRGHWAVLLQAGSGHLRGWSLPGPAPFFSPLPSPTGCLPCTPLPSVSPPPPFHLPRFVKTPCSLITLLFSLLTFFSSPLSFEWGLRSEER